MPHYLLSYELAPDYLDRRPGRIGPAAVRRGGSARAFAEADPYVREGLVRWWRMLPWATVVGAGAASPVRPASGGG